MYIFLPCYDLEQVCDS